MTETEVVEAFLSALEARDVDRALGFVDPAIVYQNVPLPPAVGLRAFERQMRLLERPFDHFEAHNHHVAQNGSFVLTERTDALGIGRFRVAFWVCGTFEVRDGRIVVWRDRFDWLQVTSRMLRALVALPVRMALRRLGR